MSREWTKAQQNAIDARNGSLLVSAAAGSGKTAVLVERVIKRITDKENPINIEDVLVVTFTKAAAGEMLERISKSLNELIQKNPNDSYLKRQKMFLPNAQISTIDGFCNQIVKENCQLLDMLPDFKILSENELQLLKQDVITEVLDEIYGENTPEVNALLELFNNGRNDYNLIQSILAIYEFSTSSANPEKWIKDHFAYYFEDVPVEKTIWGKYCLNRVKAVLEHIIIKCEKLIIDGGDDNRIGVATRNSVIGALTQMKYAVELIDNEGKWDEIRNLVNGLCLEKLGTTFKAAEKDEHYTEINERRKFLTKDFNAVAKIMSCYSEDFEKDIEKLRPVMKAFEDCVLRFLSRLTQLKKEMNAYDFADILHLSLDLFITYDEDGNPQKTSLAVETSQKYAEILIDEFQDTNEAQDALFNAISANGENLFMVGDVKQSIYVFRQAMPEIFMAYKDKYEVYNENEDNYPAKIILDKNFRSRKGIVDGVNFFFNYLMTRKMGEIDYEDGDQLVFGADYSETENKDVHLHVVRGTDSRKSNFHEEVRYVGKTIKELVESKMTVGNKGKEREINYSDICILMRGLKGKSEEVVRIFNEIGIPTCCEKKNGFFDNTEIVTMISLLKVIDNPVQDVPLVSVMLSPLFPFTEDDLAQMRCNNRTGSIYDLLKLNSNKNTDVKNFLDTLNQLRMLSVTHSVGDLIRRIFEATAYDSVVGAMNNGEKRVLNLQLLINYAEEFEKNGGHGLSGFVRYVDKLRKNKFDLKESSLVSGNDNAVTISTIHASKGLEYPVVFIMGTSDSFDRTSSDKTVVERAMGLGTVCYDKARNLEYKTQPFEAIKQKQYINRLHEEIRIYYVAMTRAREKLYIVGNLHNPESKIAEIYSRFYTGYEDNSVALSLSKSFLQWAILTAIQHPDYVKLRKDLGVMNCISRSTDSKIDFQIVDPPEIDDINIESENEKPNADKIMLQSIKEKVSYEYPYDNIANTPIKYSASRIDKDSEILYIATENPAFMGKDELTPAQRGTLAHTFMEKCDFNLAKESVEQEIARLKQDGVFTEVEAQAINVKSVSTFFESSLYNRITTCENFVREKEFTMSVPLTFINSQVNDLAKNEMIVVQGVIDGIIINGNKGEIIDYKTDKVSSEQELCEKYSEQMRVYKKAAEECFGLDEVSVTLYSFNLSKEISVKLEKNT